MLNLFIFNSLFFFFGGFCFFVFALANLPPIGLCLFLLKKKKIVYEFGSSLETGEDLLELITMPFKLDSWAGFVLEQFLLDCFLLVFVVGCISVTKFLRFNSSSFVFVFVLLSSRWLINISFQVLIFSAQIPRECFPISYIHQFNYG